MGDDIAALDGIIAGAPTWHTGADSERSGTAWDDFLYGDLTGLDLKGKKVAIFGLGDQAGYGDNFCDAMDEIKTCFEGQGASVIGSWSAEGYDHMDSKSLDGDKFVGLPCDEDNQPEMSEDRVKAWRSRWQRRVGIQSITRSPHIFLRLRHDHTQDVDRGVGKRYCF